MLKRLNEDYRFTKRKWKEITYRKHGGKWHGSNITVSGTWNW